MIAELRYSVRSFSRAPGLTFALLLTIALGVGSNAAILAFIRGLVVSAERPPSVTERTVTVFERDARYGFEPLSYAQFEQLQLHETEFERLGAARESDVSATIDGRLSYLSAAYVTPELASVLQLGLEDGPVVSDRLWRSEFDEASDLATQTIAIDGTEMSVGSVAPEWLDGLFLGRAVDLWLPLDDRHRQSTFWVLGRLREGVSVERAQAAISAVEGRRELTILPYTGMAPNAAAGLSQLTLLLPAAAGLVFFIAFPNVIAFLLSRGAARAQETSVRVALGASRRQLLSSLLADSVVIAVAGGVAGALLAFWTTGIIPALLFVEDAEQLRFVPDAAGIITASVACGAVVTLCGLVPLMDLRHDKPADVLRRESAGPSPAVRRLRRGLVIAQMACCSVLIISTGVLLSGFRAALRTTAGQHLGDAIVAKLEWKPGYDRAERGVDFFRRAEKSALAVDGIFAAAWAATLPGGRPRWTSMVIEPAGLPTREVELAVASFTSDTVERIHLPPIAGRLFGGRDGVTSCRAVLLNDVAASLLFDGSAVGRTLVDPASLPVQIVGVVAERRADGDALRLPTVYYYAEQTAPPLGREGPATFRLPVLAAGRTSVPLDVNVVSTGYFDRLGFEVAAGELWTTSKAHPGCRIAVVNQEAADQYFGGRAVGAATIDERGGRTEIVGVIHAPQLRTSQRPMKPTIFYSMSDDFVPRMTLLLSTRAATDEQVASVRGALGVADAGLGKTVLTLEEHLAMTSLAAERIGTTLIGVAALLAVALASLGMYGAMADAVRRRRREFAMRIALGAQRWRVIAHVVSDAMRLAAVGAVAGVLGSLAAAYWLARVTPTAGGLTVGTALIGPLMVALLVLAASVIPARRALSANPLAIMRDH